MKPIPQRKPKAAIPPPRKRKPTIHIQNDLISMEDGPKSEYTSKILAPVYLPKNKKPDIMLLVNCSKSRQLVKKISTSSVSDSEKEFLIAAAQRHNVFSYKLIADYYAHSSAEMQSLMEDSALVIIDFDKAIQNGFVKFSEEIKKLYVEEYEKSK